VKILTNTFMHFRSDDKIPFSSQMRDEKGMKHII